MPSARFRVRCGLRSQRFDQPFLSPRTEVRVAVRALLGLVAELGLHRLDRPAARDGLAGHRMPPQLVVAEHAEPKLLLHELERPNMAVDVTRKDASSKVSPGLPRKVKWAMPSPSVTANVFSRCWIGRFAPFWKMATTVSSRSFGAQRTKSSGERPLE